MKLNVAELKHECEERELDPIGYKCKLQNNISEYLKNNGGDTIFQSGITQRPCNIVSSPTNTLQKMEANQEQMKVEVTIGLQTMEEKNN